jgi:hypothetical protein
VTATFTPTYALTVTKSGTGTGTVTSNPAGINCGATCSYQFVSGTSVILTATPDSSSAFSGWSGDATGSSNTVTVTMSSNKSVTATFTLKYTLTVTKSGTGTGTITSNPAGINCGATCSYQFVSDTSVTLTATPDSSYVFSRWSGDATGSSNTVAVTMDSNKSVTATFYTNEAGYFSYGDNNIEKLLFGNESLSIITASQSLNAQSACNSSLSGYFSIHWATDIDKLLFSNESLSTLAATLSISVDANSACNSTLAGYFAGGWNWGGQDGYEKYDTIDKLLFSNDTRSTLWATLSKTTRSQDACNSLLAGYFADGYDYGQVDGFESFIDKLLFSSGSRSILATTLAQAVEEPTACNSSSAGYFAGGNTCTYFRCQTNTINQLTFISETNSALLTLLSQASSMCSACNSTLAGYFTGGQYYDGSNQVYNSHIDRLLFNDGTCSRLTIALSRGVSGQAACQTGGIL